MLYNHRLHVDRGTTLLTPSSEAGRCAQEMKGTTMGNLNHAWNALRSVLERDFTFYTIKEIVGLGGLDLTRIAHLEQKAGGGASKGQLMTGIDGAVSHLDQGAYTRFIGIVAEEMLSRRSEVRADLESVLGRLGWALAGSAVVPLSIFDPADLPELSPESRGDLAKAAQRLRDGDLSGALSAACGAVDSATGSVYARENLGDPSDASFQERCKRALTKRGVLPALDNELASLGWDGEQIRLLRKNLEGALNQGAYVMQTLRSKMGDVHGTKPILKPMVFDSIKWAEIIVRALQAE